MSNQCCLAPIALFVYNRPSHTRQTVEALQRNGLSRESDLVVFSDAPRSAEQAEEVLKVREYIRRIDGFKSIDIVERESNFGLAHSIIEGVSRLCAAYGRVIVLEDDIFTSPYFLQFMNDALEMYAHEDRVMHISGATYPIESMECETFFLRVPLCWGWATWDRAWRHFRKSDDVMLSFDGEMRRAFDFDDSYPYWGQLEGNAKGAISTWFVYWYATLFLREGLALFPGRSLVRNIGMDGSGVHCGVSEVYDTKPSKTAVQLERVPISESGEGVARHEHYFRNQCAPSPLSDRSLRVRILNRVRALVGRFTRPTRLGEAARK